MIAFVSEEGSRVANAFCDPKAKDPLVERKRSFQIGDLQIDMTDTPCSSQCVSFIHCFAPRQAERRPPATACTCAIYLDISYVKRLGFPGIARQSAGGPR